MSEEWRTAAQWAAEAKLLKVSKAILPHTTRGVNGRSTRESWPSRKRQAAGGGLEYPLSALPAAFQKAFARKLLASSSPAPTPRDLPPTASLKTFQREAMVARAAVLAEVDRLVMTGIGRGRAVEMLVEMAKNNTLAPDLARLVPLANARTGKSGRTLCRASIYNWLKARDEAGAVVALAPKAPKEEPVPSWAEALMAVYAVPTKVSLAWAVEEVGRILPPEAARPSYGQAIRFLKRLDSITRNKGRMGARALKSMKAYVARDASEMWPTAIYVADGHCFDAEVAHPQHGRPFRPEITTVVDVYTRRIVGWSLGLSENKWDVTSAAVKAFTEAGMCDIWYTDNGPGFNNKLWDDELTGLVSRLAITKTNSIAYNSQARGVIERLHQTVWVRAAKRLPTYMGAAMDGEARQRAFKLTRKDIKATGSSRLLLDWKRFVEFCAETVAEYNAHPHSSLPPIRDPETGKKRFMSPDEVWASAVAEGWQADVVGEVEAIDLFRPYEKRTTRRALVEIFGNSYFSPELEAFHGEEVQVGYDLTNADQVWVRALDGRFLAVAKFEGNKTGFYPKTGAEAAREKRALGRLARLDAKRGEATEEASPSLVLEMPKASPVSPEQQARLEALKAELLPSEAPAAVIPLLTKAEQFRRALDLEARREGGERLTDREAAWLETFQKSATYRSMSMIAQDFGLEKAMSLAL